MLKNFIFNSFIAHNYLFEQQQQSKYTGFYFSLLRKSNLPSKNKTPSSNLQESRLLDGA